MVRRERIELSLLTWQANILPLNYRRILNYFYSRLSVFHFYIYLRFLSGYVLIVTAPTLSL